MMWRGGVERFQSLDEIFEIGNHFRRAAGQIDRGDIRLRQPIDHAIDRLARHDFLALRPGVHVAMDAGEIAKLADVDLQNLRLRVPQRKRMLGEFARKAVVGRQIHKCRRRA